MDYYDEPAKRLPVREFEVLVAGGGTAGVVAALGAARQGARTVLIEAKGYPGGTVGRELVYRDVLDAGSLS
jgi:glycerol-3-phosphate dehydrogenase